MGLCSSILPGIFAALACSLATSGTVPADDIAGKVGLGEPFVANVSRLLGDAARGGHWKLLPAATKVTLAVTRSRELYGQSRDASSPIGLRRTAPAALDEVDWKTVAAWLQLLVKRALKQPSEAVDWVKESKFNNVNNLFEDPPVPLEATLDRNYHFYMHAESPGALRKSTRKGNLKQVSELFKKVMRRGYREVRVWANAGNVTSNLHSDPSDNIHCQLAGAKTISLFPPADIFNLYPVTFVHEGMDIDYIEMLRPTGELEEVLIPRQFRSSRGMASALDDRYFFPLKISEVDLKRFPNFQFAKHREMRIVPGTCAFIPFNWIHKLFSEPNQENVAVNYWFNPEQADIEKFRSELPAKMSDLVEESMEHLVATGPHPEFDLSADEPEQPPVSYHAEHEEREDEL